MKTLLPLLLLITCAVCEPVNAEQAKYLSEMGVFEQVRRIKFLAARYDISTDDVQRLDHVFEKKGVKWEEFSREEITLIVSGSKGGQKAKEEAPKKDFMVEERRNMELQRIKAEEERKQEESRLEQAAKLAALNAAKIKADAADIRLLHWQQQQASNDYPSAQCSLGIRYLNGKGVAKDESLARYWLEKSAAQNNAEARAALTKLTNSPPLR